MEFSKILTVITSLILIFFGVIHAEAGSKSSDSMTLANVSIFDHNDQYPEEDGLIQVRSATYGANCGAQYNNALRHVRWMCDGKDACWYRVSTDNLGDPAYGCGKDFRVDYSCADGSHRRAFVGPEANTRSFVLDCRGNGPPRKTWKGAGTACGPQQPWGTSMACPNMSPNGGPIGMNCRNVARGTKCYGASYWQDGFVCTDPYSGQNSYGSYIFNMYVCD